MCTFLGARDAAANEAHTAPALLEDTGWQSPSVKGQAVDAVGFVSHLVCSTLLNSLCVVRKQPRTVDK